VILIPAILTDDPTEARNWIEKIKETGEYERIQVDFVDGEYSNNLTIRPGDVLVSEFEGLKFDAHLMLVQKNILGWTNEAEISGYQRIISQVESISDPESFSALALDMHSPVAAIEPYLAKLELVVVMAVEPGFGGQKFSDETIEKIKNLNSLRIQSSLKFRICVDGGVQKEHLAVLQAAGADEAAVGVKRVLEW
jgi:ribulose-phosphate 3-epimerase